MGDSHVGLQARLMSQALRKLAAAISKSNTAVIFINQLREKVGIVYGNPEVTPGGRALKFYSSVRIDLRRTETIMQGGEAMGNHVKAKIVKNRLFAFSAEFDIIPLMGLVKRVISWTSVCNRDLLINPVLFIPSAIFDSVREERMPKTF